MDGGRDEGRDRFLTPQEFMDRYWARMGSPRGPLLIASCRSGDPLAKSVALRYREQLSAAGADGHVSRMEALDFQFSDGETCVRLEYDVNGHDVFLFQALYDPVSPRSLDRNYMAFLIAARAFREWGANQVTGVLPYLAYARQDKPTAGEREPTTAELMADLSIEAGIDRLVTWDPHTGRIHGFYGGAPVDGLSPLTLFQEAFGRFRRRDDVIAVAPDAGASKFVMRFGRLLGISCAVASKHRPRPEEAEVSEVMGDFDGKRVAIVLDDMINTGGTVEASITRLVEEKGIEEVYLGVSHNLCSERALERLSTLNADYGLREVVVTNSIPQTDSFEELPFLKVRSIADALSRVINRIHYNRSASNRVAEALAAEEG